MLQQLAPHRFVQKIVHCSAVHWRLTRKYTPSSFNINEYFKYTHIFNNLDTFFFSHTRSLDRTSSTSCGAHL